MVAPCPDLITTHSALHPRPPAPQFLCDDKGSVAIAVFGLGRGTVGVDAPPPGGCNRPDDAPPSATAGVLASLAACARLWERGLLASAGVSTGPVFVGPLGCTGRREYAVLGDTVNTAARLMQRAATVGGGVICDDATAAGASGCGLGFVPLEAVIVKGRAAAVRVCRPYPPTLAAALPQRDKPGTLPSAFAAVAATQAGAVADWGVLRPTPPPLRALRLAAAASALPAHDDPLPLLRPSSISSASSTASAVGGGSSSGSRSTVRYRRRPDAALSSGSITTAARGDENDGIHHRSSVPLTPPSVTAAVAAPAVPMTLDAVFPPAAISSAAAAPPVGGGRAKVVALDAASAGSTSAITIPTTTDAATSTQHTRLPARGARTRKGGADPGGGSSSGGDGAKGGATSAAADPFAPPPPSSTFALSTRVVVPPSTHNAALRGITPVYALDVCVGAEDDEGASRFLLPVPEGGDGDDDGSVLSQLAAAVDVDAVPLLRSDPGGGDGGGAHPAPAADLALLRDSAVDSAVTRGLLPLSAAAEPGSFRLRVAGTAVLLPALRGVPAAWLWEVVRACRAVNARSMAHDGVLRVVLTADAVGQPLEATGELVAADACGGVTSDAAAAAAATAAVDNGAALPTAVTTVTHGGAFAALLGCKLRLAVTGAPAVVTLSAAPGGGATAVLQRFALEALPGTMSQFALPVPAVQAPAPEGSGSDAAADRSNVWCDWGGRYLRALAGELRLGDATAAAERVIAACRSSGSGGGGGCSSPQAAAAAVEPSLWNRCFGTRLLGTEGGPRSGDRPTAAVVAAAVLVLLHSACSVQPAALLIDSVHRMSEDEAVVTRAVVAALGGGGGQQPQTQLAVPRLKLLLVLAGRDDVPHTAVLRSAPVSGGGVELHRLRLAPLSRAQSDTLLAASLRWGGVLSPSLRAYVWAAAEGNPGATLAVATTLLTDGWLAWAPSLLPSEGADAGEIAAAGLAGSLSAAAAAAVPWGVCAAGIPPLVPLHSSTAPLGVAAVPLLPAALATLRAAAQPRPGALSVLDRLLPLSTAASSVALAGSGKGSSGGAVPAHASLQRSVPAGGGSLSSTLQRLSSIARFGGRPVVGAAAATTLNGSSGNATSARPVNPLYLHTHARGGGSSGGGKRHVHVADVLAAAGASPPPPLAPSAHLTARATAGALLPAAAVSTPRQPVMPAASAVSCCCPSDLPFGPLAVLDAAAAQPRRQQQQQPLLLGGPSRVLLLRPPPPSAWAAPSLPLPPSLHLSAGVRGVDAVLDGLPAQHRLAAKALALCDGALRQPDVALQQLTAGDCVGVGGIGGCDDAASAAVAPVAVPGGLLLRVVRAATGAGEGVSAASAEDSDSAFTAAGLAQLLQELAAAGIVRLRSGRPVDGSPPLPSHVTFTSPLGTFAAGRRVLPEQARPVLRALAAAPEVAAARARAVAAAAAAAAAQRRRVLLLAAASSGGRWQPTRMRAAPASLVGFRMRDLPLPPPQLPAGS